MIMQAAKPRKGDGVDGAPEVLDHLIEVGAIFLHEPHVGPVVSITTEHLHQAFAMQQDSRERAGARRSGERLEPGLREPFAETELQRCVPVVRP